jgi:hypothetical protein
MLTPSHTRQGHQARQPLHSIASHVDLRDDPTARRAGDRALIAGLALAGLCVGWAASAPGCARAAATDTTAESTTQSTTQAAPALAPAAAPSAAEPTMPIAQPAPQPAAFTLAAGQGLRVGGDTDIAATFAEGVWRSGTAAIPTPLPVGYPAPTPPGAIDIKKYPVVRRAEVRGMREVEGREGASGFWPLFNHISRRDIEMTSPVEMEYGMLDRATEFSAAAPAAPEENARRPMVVGPDPAAPWTMSFLYRRVDQGPTGLDENDGRVVVFDSPEMLVASRGFQGNYSDERLLRELDVLAEWVAADGRFEPAGRPRVLMYNGGPGDRPSRYWGEVQLPVKPKGAPATPGTTPGTSPATPPATPGT